MFQQSWLTGLCLAMAVWLAAENCQAQARARYVPPAGNPLPNALNFFRRDSGILDPFNAFIVPRRQLNADLYSLQAQELRNFRQTQREIKSIRESEAAPTGVGAGFMNHTPYFQNGRVPQVRRQ